MSGRDVRLDHVILDIRDVLPVERIGEADHALCTGDS